MAKEYSSIKKLTLVEFEESLDKETFWLDAIRNLLELNSINEVISIIKQEYFTEEFYDYDSGDDLLSSSGPIAAYISDIDFPASSYYIRLFTKAAFRDTFIEKIKKVGYLDSTNLGILLRNFRASNSVVYINNVPIHKREELIIQVEELLEKLRNSKTPHKSIFKEF